MWETLNGACFRARKYKFDTTKENGFPPYLFWSRMISFVVFTSNDCNIWLFFKIVLIGMHYVAAGLTPWALSSTHKWESIAYGSIQPFSPLRQRPEWQRSWLWNLWCTRIQYKSILFKFSFKRPPLDYLVQGIHLSKSGTEAHWFRVHKKKYMSLFKKIKGWSCEGRRLGSRIDLSKPLSQQEENWLVTERGQIKNIRGYRLFVCLKAAWSPFTEGTHVDIRDVLLMPHECNIAGNLFCHRCVGAPSEFGVVLIRLWWFIYFIYCCADPRCRFWLWMSVHV